MRNLSKNKFAILLVLIFMIGSYLYHFGAKNVCSSTENQYQIGMIKLQQYLFHLNSECRRGEFDIAQNTFLDLQQHWQRQDVIYKSMPTNISSKIHYLPSDSLATLENYLNQVYESSGHKFKPDFILKEIRRINDKVDMIH